MVAFIQDHRGDYGVEPICKVLPIAPSTFYVHQARQDDPSKAPPRTQRDLRLKPEIQRVWDDNFRVYGARKVWRQLIRERIDVARCTVERLMRVLGLQGATRGKRFKVTTTTDDTQSRPADLVNRDFNADRPNRLWVSDLGMVEVLPATAADTSVRWSCRPITHGARRQDCSTASGSGQPSTSTSTCT